jgi:hypothetical protein
LAYTLKEDDDDDDDDSSYVWPSALYVGHCTDSSFNDSSSINYRGHIELNKSEGRSGNMRPEEV